MHQFFSSFTLSNKGKPAPKALKRVLFVVAPVFMLWAACQSPAEQEQFLAQDKKVVEVEFLTQENAVKALALGYEMNLDAQSMTIATGNESVEMAFEGASADAKIIASEREARYEAVYPGTNLRLYDKGDGNAGYDFDLAPGADPSRICMKLDQYAMASINDEGELVLHLANEEIHHTAPVAYQDIDGERKTVESRFVLAEGCVGFEMGDYDPAYGVTIDPKVYKRMVCGVSIDNVTVSGCFYDATLMQSRVAISVEVSWEDGPGTFTSSLAGPRMDRIAVTLGGQTLYVYQEAPYGNSNGAPIGYKLLSSPQVVTFYVPAGSPAGNINAAFTTNGACSDGPVPYTVPAPCNPSPCAAGSGIGGKVFEDYAYNGTLDPGDSEGVQGITVNLYTCDGSGSTPTTPTYSTVSDVNGDYTFTPVQAPAGGRYRIEFVIPPALAAIYSRTLGESQNYSDVQFATSPSCDVNLGLNNSANYCQPDPFVFLNCFARGTYNNSIGTNEPTIVRYNYGQNNNAGAGNTYFGTHGQTGSIWGMAYDRKRGMLYSASCFRRHSGLGPLGLGGIYVTDVNANPATNPTTTFLDLDNAPFTENFGTEPARTGLPNTPFTRSRDDAAFPLVGTIGMGDIDYNEFTDELYTVNLNTKELVIIDLSGYDPTSITPTEPGPADITRVTLPAPCTGSAGQSRPWAVKARSDGTVYVGMVCDGTGPGGTASDLRAYIYEYVPGTGFTATPVLDFPLTYPKGSPHPGSAAVFGDWEPWISTWGQVQHYGFLDVHPQPVLADIEFDVDGSMVIGFLDRAASLQFGSDDYGPGTNDIETGIASGDILRAYSKGGVFILENNAQAGPSTGAGPNNFQGPGFGEFYDDNFQNGPRTYDHAEVGLGGLALAPGSGEVVGTFADPFTNTIWSAGTRNYDNNTGNYTSAYVIYRNSSGPGSGAQFGKGGGLGDLELICDTLEAIEIGNYVWVDRNRNGLQDPCEPPLPGVTVQLYSGATLVATTTSGTNGEYYFSDQTYPAITPGTNYSIVFGDGQINSSGVLFDTLIVTLPNQGPKDIIDSDVIEVAGTYGGLPHVNITTPSNGNVNHSFDAGFSPFNSLGNFVWFDIDGDGTQDPGEPPIPGVSLSLRAFIGGVWVAAVDVDGNPIPDQTTDANGNYLFELMPDGQYIVWVNASNWVSGPFSPGGAFPGLVGTAGFGPDNGDNTDDNGDKSGQVNPAAPGVLSAPITIVGGSEPVGDGDNNSSSDLTIDFGFSGFNLGNQVWHDADNSGHVNPADGASPGIGGVIVELTDGTGAAVDNPLVAGTQPYRDTTNAAGLYIFNGLTAGDYRVRVITGNFVGAGGLNGFYPSNGPQEEDNPNLDGDNNDNGLDPGDAGYPGSPSASGVISNVLTLGIAPPEPLNESPDNNTGVADNRSNLTLDFGFYEPMNVGNLVFLDTDADGLQAGEPTLAGVTLSLFVNDGTGNFVPANDVNGAAVPFQTTAPNGLYNFTLLPPGEYIVRVTGNTSGYDLPTSSGGDPDGNASNDDSNLESIGPNLQTQPVTLINGTEPAPGDGDGNNGNLTLDLGFVGYSLGNFVWLDVDNSGDAQASESGIGNVELRLCDGAGNPVNQPGTAGQYTVTTNPNGFYIFRGLPAGQYIVKVPASQFGGGGALNGLFSSSGAAESGTPNDDIDQDDNGLNGTVPYNPSANGVQSAPVNLGLDALPEPTGETPTASGTPGNDGTSLADNRSHLALDFGFVGPVQLGNFVWYDLDVDGVQDGLPTEPGIAGVRLQLEVCNANGSFGPATNIFGQPVGIEVTGSGPNLGAYLFENLTPGNYRVTVMADNWNDPNPFGPSGPYAGAFGTLGQGGDDNNNSDDNGDDDFVVAPADGINSVCFNLEFNGEGNKIPLADPNRDATLDFGIARGLSLGNRVWFDTDNSSTIDLANEEGADGVTVVLYNADGSGNPTTPVDTTETCGGGYYLFTLLPPGDYVVVIPAHQFAQGLCTGGLP